MQQHGDSCASTLHEEFACDGPEVSGVVVCTLSHSASHIKSSNSVQSQSICQSNVPLTVTLAMVTMHRM